MISLYKARESLGTSDPGLIVVTYHRISTSVERGDPLKISLDTFEKQMAHIRRRYRVVSGSAVAEWIAQGRSPPSRSCLVTFDDGWGDNYGQAFSVLRAYDIPALIFLSTDFIGSEPAFWSERVRQYLQRPLHATPPI